MSCIQLDPRHSFLTELVIVSALHGPWAVRVCVREGLQDVDLVTEDRCLVCVAGGPRAQRSEEPGGQQGHCLTGLTCSIFTSCVVGWTVQLGVPEDPRLHSRVLE